MRKRLVIAATLCAAAAGCGGADGDDSRAETVPDHVVPARPLAAGPRLVEPAPEWVREFCAEVIRRSELACPGAVPSGLEALELPQVRPGRRAYVLRGIAGSEWRISGRAGASAPALADARVQRRGGRLALRWSRYEVSVAAGDDPRLHDQLRAVARGMARG